MVGQYKLWYKMTVSAVLEFFVVSPSKGLSGVEAANRAKKFGYNNPSFITRKTEKFYKYDVFRGGKAVKVAINKLVLGDVIILRAGNIAPADIRVIKVNKFYVKEQYIYGNAGDVAKNTFASKGLLETPKQKNMVFSGSDVSKGSAAGVVVNLSQDTKAHAFNAQDIKRNIATKGLAKNNFVLNRSIKLKDLRAVDCVVFDDLHMPEEVVATMQKLYLQKGLTCVYFLNSNLLKVLKKDMPELELSNANGEIRFNNGVVFIKSPTSPQKTKVVSAIAKQGLNSVYIYRGVQYEPASSVANMSLLVATSASQVALHKADIISFKLNYDSLAKIVYNKLMH